MTIDLKDEFLRIDNTGNSVLLVWRCKSGEHAYEEYIEPPQIFAEDISGMDQRDMTFDISEALRQLEAEVDFQIFANDNF